MNIKTILVGTIVVFFVLVDVESRKTSGRRSGGWGLLSRSSTSSQSKHQQTHEGGSNPSKIGWNVPDSNRKKNNNNTPKPSAPLPEQNVASKTSATSLQSGYNPSGGYPSQNQPNNNNYGGRQPAYNPYSNTGQGYNPSAGGHAPYGQSYNPSYGQSYNPSHGQPYNPSYGGHSSYGQPSYGQPSFGQPSFGQSTFGQTPQQTILLQQGSKPGIGQLAKEAFVFAGVSAGVNAAVNRLLPGGIHGHRDSGGSPTQITYNNYYNNQSAPNQGSDPATNVATPAPANVPNNAQNSATANPNSNQSPPPPPPPAEPAQTAEAAKSNSQNSQPTENNNNNNNNNPNPLGYVISNDDIKKISEDLFNKDKNNAYKYITMNLQGQKKDDSNTDDAPDPLFDVKSEAYEIPTIKAVLNMHDNYELDVKTKETVTSDERKEENKLLDEFFETDIFSSMKEFLAKKGYIENDEYEFKDTLKRIWFSQFKRIDGDASSSGFETVFLAEQFDSDIIGLHNWIYYAKQEAEKKINYLGYIKEVKLGDKGAIIKVRSTLNGIVQPITTIFVGTSPELEMALYTICFFVRPNNVCPLSLGGTEFIIIANRVNYFGKDIIISAYPDI